LDLRNLNKCLHRNKREVFSKICSVLELDARHVAILSEEQGNLMDKNLRVWRIGGVLPSETSL
jgi:hypothetical protein